MEEIYINIETLKPFDSRTSPTHTGPRSPERSPYGFAILGLGLLCVSLLAGLIGLGVHYHNVERGFAVDLSSLTEERDQLSTNLTAMTIERDQPHRRLCPTGWMMFGCVSCYLLSSEAKFWEISRQDCRNRGADLVVIDSPEEQIFLSTLTNGKTSIWIGLSDRDEEGTWKWIDETPLTLTYWSENQPDNGNGDPVYGEEDCVQFQTINTNIYWNDLSCAAAVRWVCEKAL